MLIRLTSFLLKTLETLTNIKYGDTLSNDLLRKFQHVGFIAVPSKKVPHEVMGTIEILALKEDTLAAENYLETLQSALRRTKYLLALDPEWRPLRDTTW